MSSCISTMQTTQSAYAGLLPRQYSRRERKRNRKLTKRHTRQVCGVNSAAREANEVIDCIRRVKIIL